MLTFDILSESTLFITVNVKNLLLKIKTLITAANKLHTHTSRRTYMCESCDLGVTMCSGVLWSCGASCQAPLKAGSH